MDAAFYVLLSMTQYIFRLKEDSENDLYRFVSEETKQKSGPSSPFIEAIHCDLCDLFEGKLKKDKSFPLSFRLSLVQQ